MTTQEVANQLVKFCREGQFTKAQADLYSSDVVSVEPDGAPNEKVEGIAAVNKKGEEWDAMVQEVHSSEISEPLVAGNFFSISMISNITFKGAPGPTQIEEICLYEVKDGKIVLEQFFYTQEPQVA